ncbi:hypothetical protein H112_08434 [Trichophyton rubrum D6]|uniref:Uncharacterized protein n=3 Tax=Trichophyton rubrum TaxID=5551 RepID=A0A178ET37_TRIRU|nr:uncharacterized protein TERG_01000 [Trichophyton rubrum CBS 118892]EZF10224.1 hypothetical protein H100_08457 [Trichophyton rubrum MR850]EZF37115.1 hypothetical protein H102_08416 [Trichophyton rubrum CBS 100081]EZF47678.1 hypothetical protein H103_08439 [Trichophyton rubrum CBS 288.86]EZF58467.1 hypothetical protein H104_08391 [Trichophyton rubrum CBS 289.86]EZF79686.1 hypothetical protein H110_08441 [Trichophyton rubrum MR1448]EZF90282.1 hypothetical protein H113_08509 [Trichophyton rubr
MAKLKPELELVFERKNKDLLKIPKNARIEKRPIPHPPAASPYAGASVPKVVYVSTKSPFMSIAKRVQKLLREAEKRATQSISLGNKRKSGKDKLTQLKNASEALRKEPVFIKATGRAIDKAIEVGKWFDKKDGLTTKVKTGTVMVVDDIVRDEVIEAEKQLPGDVQQTDDQEDVASKADAERKQGKNNSKPDNGDLSDLPDSRTRWVNMVEITITMD